jgi:phosphoribosylformylglycinamidine synthase
LNFGNPEKPEIMGQIVCALKGMTEACKELNYPVVSGNASLYNETNGKAIKPTPAIGGVGIIDDLSKVTSAGFKNSGNTIIRIGEMEGHLGASIYAEEILGIKEGYAPPEVDLDTEKQNGEFISLCIEQGWISACHDISDGGQLVTLAEMAIAGNIGAKVEVACSVARAFGEDQGRYIITAPHEFAERILVKAAEEGIAAIAIGETGSSATISLLLLKTIFPVSVILPITAESISHLSNID